MFNKKVMWQSKPPFYVVFTD